MTVSRSTKTYGPQLQHGAGAYTHTHKHTHGIGIAQWLDLQTADQEHTGPDPMHVALDKMITLKCAQTHTHSKPCYSYE